MPTRESRPRNPLPLFRDSTASRFPLSAGQARLWWLRQLDSSHDQYHITVGWRFAEELNREALLAALGGLMQRHEMLRTKFIMLPDRGSHCFDGAVAISGPLTEHRLGTATPDQSRGGSRFFLSAGREEKDIILDDGLSLVEATVRTAEELADEGHVVRSAIGEGGHYAAWESMLPDAIRRSLDDQP